MESRITALNAFVNNPKYADYLAILKGARNGFVYGWSPAFHGRPGFNKFIRCQNTISSCVGDGNIVWKGRVSG